MARLLARQLFTADVAGRDDQRQAQLGAAVLEERQALGVGEDDSNFVARRHVAHLDGEDVVALLLEQRGALSLVERLGVLTACFAALLDLRLQRARADTHLEAADGASAGEREDVDGFDHVAERIVELLLDGNFGDPVDDARFERDSGERQRGFVGRVAERAEPARAGARRNVDHRDRRLRVHRLPPFFSARRAARIRCARAASSLGAHPSSATSRSPGSTIASLSVNAGRSGAVCSCRGGSESIRCCSSASLRPYISSWMRASGRSSDCSTLMASSWSRCRWP